MAIGVPIQLDYAGLMHLHGSPLILDEMSRALVKSGRKPDLASAKAHEALMDLSLPNPMVDVSTVQVQRGRLERRPVGKGHACGSVCLRAAGIRRIPGGRQSTW